MLKKFWAEEKGQSMVMFAIFLVALIGFAGLAIDGGRLYISKSQLQKAVDAAALAGAQEMISGTEDDARITAEDYARKNYDKNDNPISYTIEFPSNDKIKVTGHEVVPFFLISVLMPKDKEATVPASATVQLTRTRTVVSNIWDYLIFSAATADSKGKEFETTINGGENKFSGDIHINGASKIGNNPIFIDGKYEYVGTLDDKHNSIENTKEKKSAYIEMVKIDKDEYKRKATKVFNSEDEFFKNISAIKSTDTIFVNGDVHFSGNSNVYKWATLYVSGDISINGNGHNFSGLLYAPNGEIRIDGGGMTFKGSLIAYHINTLNGSNNTYTYDGQFKDQLSEEDVSIKIVE
ncbi:TadE/TadG family type IV pilus assembly protein [Neobacillus sp. 19]|uniref:TadE/TadG family type IV pilus assembly protein n=1 Tax=Neobacillus sp. 19 TaxID=3394458 RepID=UPI003BF65E7E